jgi:hypothetical protein
MRLLWESRRSEQTGSNRSLCLGAGTLRDVIVIEPLGLFLLYDADLIAFRQHRRSAIHDRRTRSKISENLNLVALGCTCLNRFERGPGLFNHENSRLLATVNEGIPGDEDGVPQSPEIQSDSCKHFCFQRPVSIRDLDFHQRASGGGI